MTTEIEFTPLVQSRVLPQDRLFQILELFHGLLLRIVLSNYRILECLVRPYRQRGSGTVEQVKRVPVRNVLVIF